MRTLRLLLMVGVIALVACDRVEVEVSLPGYQPGNGFTLPKAYAVGQNVSFLATEYSYPDAGGKYPGATSTTAPSRFTWTSSDPTVASVAGGVVRMLKVGAAKITVTTANDDAEFFVKVVVPPASVEATPENLEIGVGEKAWITVTARDNSGATLKSISSGTGLLELLPLDLATNYRNPIAALTDSDEKRIALFGMRTGTVRVKLLCTVYGAHLLADTVTITVR